MACEGSRQLEAWLSDRPHAQPYRASQRASQPAPQSQSGIKELVLAKPPDLAALDGHRDVPIYPYLHASCQVTNLVN